MSLPNGSASASTRTMMCPASLAFPQVHRNNADARRGRSLHRFVCACITGTPLDVALAKAEPELRDTCARINWRELGADLIDVKSETAYALDPFARTARFLGADIDRGYERFELTVNEIPGSLDIEGLLFDDTPVIIDLKSGWLDVPDAEDNRQGLFFGAVKYLMLGAKEVEFRIARLRPNGDVRTESSARYTAFEIETYLDEYCEALTAARAAKRLYLAGGVPDVTVGEEWCRYCSSMEHCPAYAKLARSMVDDMGSIESRVASLSLQEAGEAWLKGKQVKGMLDRVFDALEARSRQTPLPTRPGKEVRPLTFERSYFNADAAKDLLRGMGATSEQIDALSTVSTVEQIRELNDPTVPKSARSRKARAA